MKNLTKLCPELAKCAELRLFHKLRAEYEDAKHNLSLATLCAEITIENVILKNATFELIELLKTMASGKVGHGNTILKIIAEVIVNYNPEMDLEKIKIPSTPLLVTPPLYDGEHWKFFDKEYAIAELGIVIRIDEVQREESTAGKPPAPRNYVVAISEAADITEENK